MKMAPNNGKKIKYFISVLLIVGSFLFISISPTYALLNDYNKPYNGTLSATEWNNLDNDFLNRTGVASMEGPLSITAGGLTVNGTVSATSFAGALSARNVSSGIFGIDQGGGNFMFPGNLAVGTTNPAGYTLDVSGDINFTGTLRQNGTVFTGSKWTNNGLNIYYNSGNVGVGLTSPGQQLDVNLGLRAQSLILKGFAGAAGIVMTDAAGLLYSATSPEGNITLPGGTNGATLRYDSVSGNWLSNTFLFNSGTGIGIGTTNPESLITIANNQWLSARNGLDSGIVNMFKVNSSNQIEVGAPLIIGPLEFAEDSGLVSFLDMPVTSSATLGTPEGYTMKIDGNNLLTLYSESNGAGGVQNMRLGVGLTNPSFKVEISDANPNIGFMETDSSNKQWHLRGVGGNFEVVETGVDTRLFFQAGGNVGIGTTAPAELLHVADAVQFDGIANGVTPGSTQTLALTTVEYVNNMVTGVSTSTVGYWSANGTNIYNANSGNVGIGTSVPGAKLDVVGGGLALHDQPLMYRGAADSYHRLGYANPYAGIADADYWNFNNVLVFSRGPSTPRMVVMGSGNVGIGTTAPGALLHVAGNAWVTGTFYPENIQTYSGDLPIIIGAAGNVPFRTTVGTDLMIIKGDGNVGIATTNPTQKFHVNGGAQIDAVSFGVTPGTTQTLALTTVEYVNSMVSGASTSTVGFWSQNGNNIYNANSGNVGVGTTNPSVKLDVVGIIKASGSDGRLALENPSVTTSIYLRNSGASAQRQLDIMYGASNVVTINNSGNVGIGTTNPGNKLEIAGNVQATGAYYLGANSTAKVRLDGSVGSRLEYGSQYFTVDSASAHIHTNSVERVTIKNDGNVGISVTNPTQKLHVNGGAQLDAISFGVTPGEAQTLALTTVEYVNAKVGGSAGITTGTSGQTLRHNGTGWVANSLLYNNGTNVGIGTTNPSKRLHIVSSGQANVHYDQYAKLVVEDTEARLQLVSDDGGSAGTNIILTNAPDVGDNKHWFIHHSGPTWGNRLDIGYVTTSAVDPNIYSSGQLVSILNNGDFGIGTTAPTEKLHLIASGNLDGLRIDQLGSGANTSITFDTGNVGGYEWRISAFGNNHTEGGDKLAFQDGTVTRMLINSSGNVGINTTNPTQKLHVNGGAQLDSVSFGVTPGTSQKLALATVEFIDNMISGVSTSTVGYWSANGNHIYNANSLNVGIGISAPANKLDISGSLGVNGILKGYGSGNGNFFEGKLGVNSLSAGASSLAVFGNAAIGTSYLSTSAPANGLIVQGNVGIATSTPAEALHIVGNLRVDGGATISGNLNMSGSTLIVNKITANTIDPLYTIDGVKYSTFAPSIVGGVKEEYVGRVYKDDFRKVGVEYEAIIDMSKLEEGSDLWVWRKVVDFSSDNVDIFLTPKGERASIYADIENDRIVIRSDRAVDAYLRLVGNRYDWRVWPTKASDQNQSGGLLIN